MAKINPAATVIPDKAEVWIALKSDVTDINGVIPASMIPSAPTDDLEALGWEFSGLIDDKKGIPVNPAIEVKPYDAFGHPRFRVKLKKGTLETGFTVLETNSVTRKFVLPGSSAKRIGIPKDVQIFVLYRFVDEDIARVWVSLTPAPVEVKSHGGVVDGELSFAECVVHHTATADGDVFELLDNAEVTNPEVTKVFTIDSGVTAYTVTVDGETTTSISTMTATALQAALRALPNVGSDGVTVTGSSGGPLTAVFSVVVTTVSAAGTGGDVAVS